MARFVFPHDRLKTVELPDHRYQLLAPLWYESDLLGGHVVKAPTGFVSDLETIWRWLPLTYAWLSRTANRSGVIHNLLYQLHKVGTLLVPRSLADAVYYEATREDGNSQPKRWVKWLGVRIGGAQAYAAGPARFQHLGNERRKRPRP